MSNEIYSPYGRKSISKIDSSEKDILISQLKSQIFELEQNEKNFSSLNLKFRKLQADFNQLTDDKNRIEYEYRQKNDHLNKVNGDQVRDLHSLQDSYNEKIILNKKLYSELDNLERVVDGKNEQITHLQRQLDQSNESNARLYNEKLNLEKSNAELNDIKNRNKHQIDKLNDNVDRLNHVCNEQDQSLKNLEFEKSKLQKKFDELTYENNTNISKFKASQENLNYTKGQLEDANKKISHQQGSIFDLEGALDRTKQELSATKDNLSRETRVRMDGDKQIQDLDFNLREREKEIKRLNLELELMRGKNEKLMEDNGKLYSENDRCRNHIAITTEQNNRFIDEIEHVQDEDDKVRHLLNRRERLQNLVRTNRGTIERSAQGVDELVQRNRESRELRDTRDTRDTRESRDTNQSKAVDKEEVSASYGGAAANKNSTRSTTETPIVQQHSRAKINA